MNVNIVNNVLKFVPELKGGTLKFVTEENNTKIFDLSSLILENTEIEFKNLPKSLTYNSVTKKITGKPSGKDAGRRLIYLTQISTVTKKVVKKTEIELNIKSTISGDENTKFSYSLPEFKDLSTNDLSDNIIVNPYNLDPGIDLSLNDLSKNKLWDFSNNDISLNDLSDNWLFTDQDWATDVGDVLYYEAILVSTGEKIPKTRCTSCLP